MPRPWPDDPPGDADRARYADAAPVPYWIDAGPRREPTPPLAGRVETDLCIVGGGFTGLRLAAADRRAGRRGLWLRALDRFGLGFDS